MTLRELIEHICEQLLIDIQDDTLSQDARDMLDQAWNELQAEEAEKGYIEPVAAEFLDQDAAIWIAESMRRKNAN